MAGISAHPAVKAISPQAPMTDVWMGDDFFHNGAFRESYGFDYVQEMEAQIDESRQHAAQFKATLALAQKRFAALAKVEERHAAHYRDRLAQASA